MHIKLYVKTFTAVLSKWSTLFIELSDMNCFDLSVVIKSSSFSPLHLRNTHIHQYTILSFLFFPFMSLLCFFVIIVNRSTIWFNFESSCFIFRQDITIYIQCVCLCAFCEWQNIEFLTCLFKLEYNFGKITIPWNCTLNLNCVNEMKWGED